MIVSDTIPYFGATEEKRSQKACITVFVHALALGAEEHRKAWFGLPFSPIGPSEVSRKRITSGTPISWWNAGLTPLLLSITTRMS